MRIALGADHGGYELKGELGAYLRATEQVKSLVDLGTYTPDSVDYPDFARRVANAVADGAVDRGILVCGSGVGVSITANKVIGVRASVCHDTYSARQGVEHDDMNVLCLGGRVIGSELALELVRAFVHAEFDGKERHRRRVEKIRELERLK